jgi:hypothetical protein
MAKKPKTGDSTFMCATMLHEGQARPVVVATNGTRTVAFRFQTVDLAAQFFQECTGEPVPDIDGWKRQYAAAALMTPGPLPARVT